MHQLVRDRGTDFVIKVRAGSLYHTVERLYGLGLIEPVETGREGRRPERTVYAITGTGRDEFVTNLGDLLRFPAEEYPVFAAALEMLAALDVTAARRLLEQRTIALEAEVAAGEQITATLTKQGLGRIHLVENEYVAHMCRAELAWVRGLIADIDTGELAWTPACRPAHRSTAAPGPAKASPSARITGTTAPPAAPQHYSTTIERTIESEELAS
jgi:DNA-binding PadR family transcriptional regulator